MSDLPPLAILITTLAPAGGELRVQAAVRAVKSWQKHLKYAGKIHVHVADDGSSPSLRYGWDFWNELVGDGMTFSYSRQEAKGVGASLNAGLAVCHEKTPITLYAVDDWELTHDFDATPWAELLMENEDVGCIRLGIPNPFLRQGTIRLFNQGWTVDFERYGYYWAMRPAIYHRRFFDSYGVLPEMVNPYEVDRIYNEHICRNSGPDVLLALFCPFQHIWSIELGDIEPGGDVPKERLQGVLHTDG